MRSFKQVSMVFLVTILLVILSSAAALAGKPAIRPNASVSKPRIPKTDLEVREIYSDYCSGDESRIGKADGMFFQNIKVIVGNYSCAVGVIADAEATLTVRYFDLVQHRTISKTIPVTLSKNQTKTVNVASGYFLLKKSVGIQARISMSSRPVRDCNASNNSNEVHECQLRPVY